MDYYAAKTLRRHRRLRPKYKPDRVIFVDIDGTLLIDGQVDEAIIKFLEKEKKDGFMIILWSSRGLDYATDIAKKFEITQVFNFIIPKPAYIIDDYGWNWTRFVENLFQAGYY